MKKNFHKTLALALTLLMSLAIVSPVFAQEVSEPKTEAVKIETVVQAAEKSVDNKEEALKASEPVIDAKAAKALKKIKESKAKMKKLKDVDVSKIIFAVVGGLGIFLLGMKYMSEGLQTIAGPTLKKLIKMMTANRFLAIGSGALITMLVQSSSVSTVMAVGFVNSGIMELQSAIGVVMGANIGTTITGWIIALKIGKYGLIILGISSFFFIFSKKETLKYTAMTFLGIGMIFFGLELMKNGFKPIRGIEEFHLAFEKFRYDGSYFSVLKCAFIGCVLTVIVQSSSATLGITIGLAATGAIDFETAAALVLGENVGTTITAFLASIGTTTNAKRAAYFHIIFNLIGVCWVTLLFKQYIPLVVDVIQSFKPSITDVNAAVMVGGEETFPYRVTAIALVHSIFNVTNVILFIPFTAVFAKTLEKVVKGKDAPREAITHLDFQKCESSFAALEQCSFEIDKMTDKTGTMFTSLETYLNKGDKKSAEDIFLAEDKMDAVQTEVTDFLTEVLTGNLSHDQTEEAKSLLLLTDELESASDYITQILKHVKRLEEANLIFSDVQKKEILAMHKLVVDYFNQVTQKDPENLKALYSDAVVKGEEINIEIRKIRAEHWNRVAEDRVPPLVTTTFTDILACYRKIKQILVHVIETRNGIK